MKPVLSGSHISAMRRLEAANRPLYGRRTARLALAPFSYREVALFLPDWSARDRLQAFGVLGGVPGNLALLDPGKTLGENVATHVLDPSGRLSDDAQHMLDAFLGEAAVHYSIVAAIAGGERTWSGITNRAGKHAGSLSRPMRWLIEMQVVERVLPVTERNPQRSKRSLYRIADPYVAFWHRFVSPLASRGDLGLIPPERLWSDVVEPVLADYMGEVFERACRTYATAPNALPFTPQRVGEWWDARSDEHIDVVAFGRGGEVLLGECKWGEVDRHDLARLEQRAELIRRELKGLRRVHLALFSGRPLSDPDLAREVRAGRVHHIFVDALFE